MLIKENLRMIIKRLTTVHSEEIHNLRKQFYFDKSDEIHRNIKNKFEENLYDYNESLGVFENGQLQGFIICYHSPYGKYYISDLFCPNPKKLLILLLSFACSVPFDEILVTQTRNKGYKIIKHIEKKIPRHFRNNK